MKFSLYTSKHFYSKEEAQRYEKLGFSFCDWEKSSEEGLLAIDDEKDVVIEINTLEELMTFVEEWGTIVLSPVIPNLRPLPSIEIYNYWRE